MLILSTVLVNKEVTRSKQIYPNVLKLNLRSHIVPGFKAVLFLADNHYNDVCFCFFVFSKMNVDIFYTTQQFHLFIIISH